MNDDEKRAAMRFCSTGVGTEFVGDKEEIKRKQKELREKLDKILNEQKDSGDNT